MVIPQAYPAPPETAIASYDYTDIDDALGYVIYYGANYELTGGRSYFLTKHPLYSDDITVISGNRTAETYTEHLNIDYDMVFNMPKNIKGTVKINMTMGMLSQGSDEHSCYLIIDIEKNGVQLATAQSQTFTMVNATSGVAQSKTACMNLELGSDRIHFKKGDTMRVTVKLFGKRIGSSHWGQFGWGQDPNDRDDDGAASTTKIIEDTDTTKMEVHLPFIIDL